MLPTPPERFWDSDGDARALGGPSVSALRVRAPEEARGRGGRGCEKQAAGSG